jgi:hypothetical protein
VACSEGGGGRGGERGGGRGGGKGRGEGSGREEEGMKEVGEERKSRNFTRGEEQHIKI